MFLQLILQILQIIALVLFLQFIDLGINSSSNFYLLYFFIFFVHFLTKLPCLSVVGFFIFRKNVSKSNANIYFLLNILNIAYKKIAIFNIFYTKIYNRSFKPNLKKCFSNIKNIFLICFLTILCSCKAITNLSEYSRWNFDYKYSTSVFTHPAKQEDKIVYVSVSNTTGEPMLDFVEKDVKKHLEDRGFEISKNPQSAKYRILANVRFFRKIPMRDLESIQENWNMELSDKIANESNNRQNNIAKLESEIARYQSYTDKGSVRLNIKEDDTQVSKKNSGTIAQILEGYKNFDLSGILLGSTIGFLTNSPKNVVLGGIYGGFFFEVMARLTNPKSYLMVIDIEIDEPRCAHFSSEINSDSNSSLSKKTDTQQSKFNEKTMCAEIFEVDKRVYKQDDYSYRKIEFSRQNEYITYRTTVYMLTSRVFASKQSSIFYITKSLPSILSNSLR